MQEDMHISGYDGKPGEGVGGGVDVPYGVEIRTLLERQPLNPFKRMGFSVLSFRAELPRDTSVGVEELVKV